MPFILALLAMASPPVMADLAITGARIYTADEAQPQAEALAIKDGRIVAVGSPVSAFTGPNTRIIDAKGATVIPGFIDAHAHLEALGLSLETLDLRRTASAAEAVRQVREEAARRKPGEWIRGRNWDQTRWPGQQFPGADALEEAAPDNPVFLSRVDGHAAWVNRRALKLAKVSRATQDPHGGRIVRDGSGEPTGILIDRAMDLVGSKMPPATGEDIERRLERAARECARLGLTTIHDAGVDGNTLRAYKKLEAAGRLPVRVYLMIGGAGSLWREYLEKGPEIGERITVRSIKLMSDGALGSRGAALLEPYSDEPGNRGILMLDREEIEAVAKQAVERGFQVNTHAIGDRANRTVLEAYAAVLKGKNDRRFRVEHAQVLHPDDFALMAAHSIIASVQATHATSDMPWAADRLGAERVKGAYAWRTLLESGARVANGSDFPVEEPNPLLGFYASVTRQNSAGNPEGGWFPKQTLTRDEALRSWTREGAYAAFEESWKGALLPGMAADLVMLSRDIMQGSAAGILETRVLLTLVGGQVVHSEDEWGRR